MKHLSLFFSVIAFSCASQSFNVEYLDIANVKAMFGSPGDLFWNGSAFSFEVPKDSGKHTLFAGNLWMGGVDAQGALHVAAQTYRQIGSDYFQGPAMNSSSYSASQDILWDKVWKINKSTIDSFRLGLFTNTPAVILGWPGNGNTALGQAAQLAPYKDINGDGIYNPANGDYPCIKGDQAVYFICNDDRSNHTESNGQKIKVEIHGMAYAFTDTSYPHLKNTVFLNYRIINRSNQNYYNFYIGMWNDFDIGDYSDDFIGCNVTGDFFFGYNGTNLDPFPGYGVSPPAQGTLFLKGPLADIGDAMDNDHNCLIDEPFEQCRMSYFTFYNNDWTVIGNPASDTAYYRYTHGIWQDGTNMTYGGNGYGGNTSCTYMFPGTSDQMFGWGTGGSCQSPSGPQPSWDETSSGNTPSDRRGIGSSGPFTFNAGEELCIDYAFVYARGPNGNFANVSLLASAADTIRHFYTINNLDTCGCYSGPLSVNYPYVKKSLSLYPNPAKESITIASAADQILHITILDLHGKVLQEYYVDTTEQTVQVAGLAAGVYFINVITKQGTFFDRFIKE